MKITSKEAVDGKVYWYNGSCTLVLYRHNMKCDSHGGVEDGKLVRFYYRSDNTLGYDSFDDNVPDNLLAHFLLCHKAEQWVEWTEPTVNNSYSIF